MGKALVKNNLPQLVKIPMKPYLVKYLTRLHGRKYLVGKKSWLGLSIIDALSKDYQKPRSLKNQSYYLCVLPELICKNHGYFAIDKKLKLIEQKTEKIFKQALYNFVDIRQEACQQPKEVNRLKWVAEFLRYYNINEDDLALETAYRNLKRHLQKTRKKTVKKNRLWDKKVPPENL